MDQITTAMPKHKEALIRYRIIDECLINRKLVTIEELIEACASHDIIVSERTIRGDIKDMQSDIRLGFDAPIVNVRPKKYMYDNPDYSINKLPLSDYEIEALGFMSKLLEQFENMAPFNEIPGAIQKIFNHLRIRNSLNEKEFDEIIDFEKTPRTKGDKFIEPLIKAIRRKQVVEIKYKYFGAKNTHRRIFHPYLLKEYRNRWYVFGYSESSNGLRLYGLDRVEKLETIYTLEYRPSMVSL